MKHWTEQYMQPVEKKERLSGWKAAERVGLALIALAIILGLTGHAPWSAPDCPDYLTACR